MQASAGILVSRVMVHRRNSVTPVFNIQHECPQVPVAENVFHHGLELGVVDMLDNENHDV